LARSSILWSRRSSSEVHHSILRCTRTRRAHQEVEHGSYFADAIWRCKGEIACTENGDPQLDGRRNLPQS
jgi:hypothetical protein